MQYVGKVGGYMYNQWNSLNPATLSGAIDIIVVEQPDGSLHCSPFHIRFGKFQIIKPSQKKIDFYVNDTKTDLPMKLGDGGEAFFVLETNSDNLISKSALTSPVISPASSPEVSPNLTPAPSSGSTEADTDLLTDLDGFDLNTPTKGAVRPSSVSSAEELAGDIENRIKLTDTKASSPSFSPERGPTPTPSINSKIAFEKAKKVTQKLNIPSKIDNNGDLVLDMDGYKPNSQKNIDNSDELLKKIFIEELEKLGQEVDTNENSVSMWDQIIQMDEDGNIRISNFDDYENSEELSMAISEQYAQAIAEQQQDLTNSSLNHDDEKTYFKTLRLTSEQLKKMNLQYGENKLMFKLNQGNSQVNSNLYLWKASTPIVISDIDGTITKSDALGHVLNFIGKDWTHPGVAKLFQDISNNGYNILYLTSRSVGQADSTRAYLQSIVQDNNTKLPSGPVILSPDRTMAALRREVILRKPEVFKMSCLNDIRSLYYNTNNSKKDDPNDAQVNDKTPFYAGFGNRITDAISYRSVYIPSHRIFTINPDGEVHLELLELSGVKSSYLGIGELVDQYFPPIGQLGNYSSFVNSSQFGLKSAEERFNDVNYWREPLDLTDLTDIEDDEPIPEPKSPSILSVRSFNLDSGSSPPEKKEREQRDRPNSISSFTSPLKGFMNFNRSGPDDSFDYGDNGSDVEKLDINDGTSAAVGDDDQDDYTEEEDYDEAEDDDYDEAEDDDYIDEDDGNDEDDEDDDYDEDDEDDYEDEGDYEGDLDHEEPHVEGKPANVTSKLAVSEELEPAASRITVTTAAEMVKNMSL